MPKGISKKEDCPVDVGLICNGVGVWGDWVPSFWEVCTLLLDVESGPLVFFSPFHLLGEISSGETR